MMQRIVRQINDSEIEADITVATSVTQYDSIVNQLNGSVDVVTEPERRDTFPAITLSAAYLIYEKECDLNEVVVVMPSDLYVESSYFDTIAQIVKAVETDKFEMVLMGVTPAAPSEEFGYILPGVGSAEGSLRSVARFVEKPSERVAQGLIEEGAVWNGGLFAFRLRYLSNILSRHVEAESFGEVRSLFNILPKISFDFEVVEQAQSVGYVQYNGGWNDLGTWCSLCDKIEEQSVGNVILESGSKNTHVINELDIPIVCLGTKDIIVAASPDGVLVSTKESSATLKSYIDNLESRPMYEERRWGTYKVMGHEHFEDGHNALIKLLHLKAGCSISYQYHNQREEIWTFVDGEGLLALDGEVVEVGRGYVAHIKVGQKHAVKAITDLQIIEVQTGGDLVEEDIIRLDWSWEQ